MKLVNLRNGIESAVSDNINGLITKGQLVDHLLSMFVVEAWDTSRTRVDYEDLTDDEFRLITEWLILNRRDYNLHQIALIKDLREVFPGLSLLAASYFVRGK
jgi:hypothetical protein